MMRSALVLAGCAAAALPWASPAQALSSETVCENIKLQAAGRYASCIAQAARYANSAGSQIDEAAIRRCNQSFDRAFERAEASGACRTAGGPSPLRSPILGQMTDTLTATTAGPGCPQAPVLSGQQWSCTLTTGTSVDLASIVAQINAEGVTLESPIWIEAWGGNGAAGDHGGNGGGGGLGGYAQTTTTVADVLNEFGSSDIYYYNGAIGTGGSDSGGQGGSASLVTSVDLTQTGPNPDENVFVIAGGGGGGGSGSTGGNCGYSGHSDIDVLGGGGGAGGQAFATTAGDAIAGGSQGGGRRDRNVSGDGGGTNNDPNGGSGGGGAATNGESGVAALGGPRGESGGVSGENGFANISVPSTISKAGGAGGSGGDRAPGGGGGGGFGGGGGGREGDGDTHCVSGGGGGGSWALASTASCPRGLPTNPNSGTGAVRIVFQIGPCED